MSGLTWTMPPPVGKAVSPSAGLGSDPPMMNWERIIDRLKTAFPQQSRYLSLYLLVSTDYTLQSVVIITAMKYFRETYHIHIHTLQIFPYQGLGKENEMYQEGIVFGINAKPLH